MKNRLLTLLGLMFLAGCASTPTASLMPINPVAYSPVPAPARLAGSAAIEATYEPAPELLTNWRKRGFTENVINRHRQEVINAVTNDLDHCGLFTRTLTSASGASRPTYVIELHCQTIRFPTYLMAEIAMTVRDGTTGNTEWRFTRQSGLGPVSGRGTPFAQALSRIMTSLKSDLANAVVAKTKEEAERAELARIATAPLADLLVASDRNSAMARERNHAIVAAKNQQLPDILRNWKTAELSALVVKIEQTILDLDHACQVAKDQAEQGIADGAQGTSQRVSRPDLMQARMRGMPAATNPGFLGISMQQATGVAGVLVESVVTGGPSDQAGLVRSDIILAADDHPMPTPETLKSYVEQTPPGSIIRLQYRRNGAELSTAVVLGRRNNAPSEPGTVDSLRDLSISYQERIELLKPILAALKEEIANRNR